MSTNPPLSMADRARRAVEARLVKNAAFLANYPFGYTPSVWLAPITGLTEKTCCRHANAAPFRLSRLETKYFGLKAYTFGPWIEAWGLDRVLAFLDAHDQAKAAFLRANLADVDNRVERVAKKNRTAEEFYASRSSAAWSRVLAAMEGQPVGLVPDSWVVKATGEPRLNVVKFRRANGIDAFPTVDHFPTRQGSFSRLIAAWGPERARAWVEKHAPEWARSVERDVAGACRVKAEPRPVVSAVAAVVAPKPKPAPARTEAEARRRPLPPTPRDVDEKPEPIRAHSVAEWLAAGGQVKRGLPAGWADPTSPSYMPAEVARRRGTGLYSGKKGWRRA